MNKLWQRAARILADSPILKPGRKLWYLNEQNYGLPLSSTQKLMTGAYIILHDYAEERFPPTFNDQKRAYAAEIDYRFSVPGLATAEFVETEMRKPFWGAPLGPQYMLDFVKLSKILEQLKIEPPQRLLELGCGTGWMAEFLSLRGYHVVGTSLSSDDVGDAQARIRSVEAKNLKVNLEFIEAPMESVADHFHDRDRFDCVYVYEALHHAYDWRQTIESAYACLKDGGWLFICAEPNVLHTYIAYRGAKLVHTHEIGMSRSALRSHLKHVGFRKSKVLSNRIHVWIKPHWIGAQR